MKYIIQVIFALERKKTHKNNPNEKPNTFNLRCVNRIGHIFIPCPIDMIISVLFHFSVNLLCASILFQEGKAEIVSPNKWAFQRQSREIKKYLNGANIYTDVSVLVGVSRNKLKYVVELTCLERLIAQLLLFSSSCFLSKSAELTIIPYHFNVSFNPL